MKKSLGIKPYLYPMPVIMVATYDENGKTDCMNMAWGTVCAEDMVLLNLDEDHKTSDNIKKTKAFTLGIPSVKHVKEADFFGIASGNRMDDKFERTGFKAVKSEYVNAPVIEEFPITLECEAIEIKHEVFGFCVIGKIVNVLCDESVLNEKGRIDPDKVDSFIFDQFDNTYKRIGEKIGKAWGSGAELMKKQK